MASLDMSPAEIQLLKASAKTLQRRGPEIATRMYENLFTAVPDVKVFFSTAFLEKQVDEDGKTQPSSIQGPNSLVQRERGNEPDRAFSRWSTWIRSPVQVGRDNSSVTPQGKRGGVNWELTESGILQKSSVRLLRQLCKWSSESNFGK